MQANGKQTRQEGLKQSQIAAKLSMQTLMPFYFGHSPSPTNFDILQLCKYPCLAKIKEKMKKV